MQRTTTLLDILQSELIKNGQNEFSNRVNGKTQITDNDKNFAFMYRVMRYDNQINDLVNDNIFNNVCMDDLEADKYFKKMFCNQFIDRQIAPQTLEAFASRVTSLYMQHMTEIKVIYEKLMDYYQEKSNSVNNTNMSDKTGNNHLTATLPQNEVDMSLDSNSMDYADNNDVTRGFNNRNSNSNTTNTSSNPDVFAKLRKVWSDILDIFDLKCFSQII